jgi:mannose-1-phosphate guanylyltransferase
MTTGPIDNFWAVVPAGGAGTRLWPLSRAGSPKFLRDFTGSGHSLIQETVLRLDEIAEDRFIVVTGRAHRDAVCAQIAEVSGLDHTAVIAEPSARDSMAAIGLAAAMLERRDPDAVMGSFAADHVITDPVGFRQAVREAVDVARDDLLVTIGIDPTFASSAFGYVHLGAPLEGRPRARSVRAFVEKPTVAVAEAYLAGGDHRWNAGMFVVRPTVLLDLLATWHPEFAEALREIAAAPETLQDRWEELPKIALDHAVAEPAAAGDRVATIPASFGWDDVGDFDSLATLLAGRAQGAGADPDAEGLIVLGDADLVRSIASTGLVVPAGGRMVSVIGLDDIVVVDTPDALLVTSRARAQEVKQVVAMLKQSGRDGLV